MTVSIVIGTRNRPESLQRCLESIVRQTVPPHEVLIVDDGALDAAAATRVLERAGVPAVYHNKSHDPGLTKSRNLGIRRSTGDVVLFLDDDVELEPGYVEALIRGYEQHPDAGGVAGRLIDPPLPWHKRVLLRMFLLDSSREGAVLANGVGVLVRAITRPTRVDWFSGCNMSYRRGVFDSFMFDERFAGNGWGDDRDFSYRVSRAYPLVCMPEAGVRHHEEPKARASESEFGRTEITYVHRFFVKNMPARAANLAALWWAFTGIAVKNALTLRVRRLAGNVAGVTAVLAGRSGAPR